MKIALCADLHAREDTPTCRTDDYAAAQEAKWFWLRDLPGISYWLNAGDLFDHWKPSPYLLGRALELLPEMVLIPGQHDLPQHNLELIRKSGAHVLAVAQKVTLLFHPSAVVMLDSSTWVHGFPFGTELKAVPQPDRTPGVIHIALVHEMVFPRGRKPFPQAEGWAAEDLLQAMPGFDLILSGDNHQSFTVKDRSGRMLVNPGSLMRMDADQVAYQPRVPVYRTEDRTLEWLPVPITEGVVSREHLERAEERNERVEAFVRRLSSDWSRALSFEDNMRAFLKKNPVPAGVEKAIWEAMEGSPI